MKNDWTAQLQRDQLHFAAQDGNLGLVDDLLRRKHPVNRFDELGKTPLHYAVAGGHLEVVDRLIEAGANVNAHDERVIGNTPLSDNVKECSYAMAKRLIDAGADPSIPGWMQLNAFHKAEERMDADAKKIQRLLSQAASKS